ncbi:Gldg family protein [uncultured Desulfosarcina sp.]|uniref:Gldg family protein n=1 Tax=uncultured Desulfosarcina sp. TaxID=218289 RepID=UPI0029C8B6A5|nr:Gldg family protein [uncultured Desulfosarcina sp.]
MSDGKRRIGKTAFSAGGALLVLAILVLVNLLLAGTNLRWDATEDNLYSLSEGTRTILSDLDQDVVIKVFYSKNVVNAPSSIKTFAQRVIDFLSEYEHYGKGKVTVEIYDPKPDSDEEEWAVTYGMKSIQLPTGENLYLGLVAMAADREAAIPFIDPTKETQLEYDLTRIISRVQTAKRLKIAVYSGLPVFGQPAMNMGMMPQGGSEPWFFIEELKKSYDLVQLQSNADSIDAETDLLLLFHPKNMSEAMMFAVDQYVLGGGNLMVFADPLSLMDDPRMGGGGSIPEKLFKTWGISVETGKAVADYTYATRLRNRENQVEENPLWLSAPASAFNTDNLITANLESMLLPVAGAIDVLPDSPAAVEPLLQTSTNNTTVDAFMHNMDVETLRRDFKPSGTVRNLAVRISGYFKTAFPDGKPAASNKEGEASAETDLGELPAVLKESRKDAVIVVVADSDLLYDGYYLSRQNLLGFTISNIFNDNLNFLLNGCEMLTGNPALIGIRSRGTFERPFTRVQELERKAQDRWLDQEQALVRQVEATNEKLHLLEQQKGAGQQAILSEEQEQEIHRFQEEKLKINKELKTVRRNLRADIERLGSTVKFVNIFLVPLLIGIGGVVYAITRRRKA